MLFFFIVAANKGEAEPERKETRSKVDEDRKHEYPLLEWIANLIMQCYVRFTGSLFAGVSLDDQRDIQSIHNHFPIIDKMVVLSMLCTIRFNMVNIPQLCLIKII